MANKDSIPDHAKGGPCDKGGTHNPKSEDGKIVCTKCGDTYA